MPRSKVLERGLALSGWRKEFLSASMNDAFLSSCGRLTKSSSWIPWVMIDTLMFNVITHTRGHAICGRQVARF